MPNIPTGGAELPRVAQDYAIPRAEPVLRAPPLVAENAAAEKSRGSGVERRRDERRRRQDSVLLEQRQGADRRERRESEPSPDEAGAGEGRHVPGRLLNVRV
jgi:hypothetical protein